MERHIGTWYKENEPQKYEVAELEPVHIESEPTQQRMNMGNNTHSFSVNSFDLIVF